MNPDISEPHETSSAANAVSLFGQGGGVNDFPVLKAFQEYIDAEQAKARKRMFGLSIFFIVLLVVVVVTFTIIMTSVISRNQSLSDRLLDIALREKNPAQPVVNVQQPTPVPVPVVQPHPQPQPQHSAESVELIRLREDLQREKDARQADQAKRDKEKIESLTAQLAKAQQQPVTPTPVVVTTPGSVVQPVAESVELARLREELRREKEERKAEQDKRAKEKKEAEKEAFLRRQYPDYYAKEDARKAAEAARRATPPLPAPAPVPQPVSASVPQTDAQATVQPVTVPDSAELNRQREELDREEKEKQLRRQREEEQRRAEQMKREEEKRKTVQAKPLPKPKESPSQTVPQKPSLNTVKPITYFDESKPVVDPELDEILRNQATRTAPKAVMKPAPSAAKPAPQPPAAKPAPKTSAQPAVTQQPAQKTVQSTNKTETLAIGGAAGGSSIPWLIELPVQ